MPFVQAKCPECGGMLAVDDSKKAAVCQFCGEAFIVQEAINNYITNNITNNNTTHNYGEGAVVNVYDGAENIDNLLKRVQNFIEEENWDKADEYCERVLDIDSQKAEAYFYKLMIELRVSDYRDFTKVNSKNIRIKLICCDESKVTLLAKVVKEWLSISSMEALKMCQNLPATIIVNNNNYCGVLKELNVKFEMYQSSLMSTSIKGNYKKLLEYADDKFLMNKKIYLKALASNF